jgi:8-oxo-dGTP pyrophosphatase MutT (NUDIX family)
MDKSLIPHIKHKLTQQLPGRAAQLRMAPTFRPDIEKSHNAKKAGVLLLLYPNPVELYIVFMKRPAYEGVHSAQISFPGGKVDTKDLTMAGTALRETHEEIGIKPEAIEIIGALTPLYIPVSEMDVYPIVGFHPTVPNFLIDPVEVDYLIEEPLQNLIHYDIRKTKPFESEKYTGNIPYFDVQGNHIWGATAMILNEFLEVL